MSEGVKLKYQYMTITAQDGSVWGVPVEMIAKDRAQHYANEFGGDTERSLQEDTIPLFNADSYEIQDWAIGEMNWSDFNGHQVLLSAAPEPDMQEAWMSGEKGYRVTITERGEEE